MWYCNISTNRIIYIAAGRYAKLFIFLWCIFITRISCPLIDITTFLNIGDDLNRAYMRIKIRIAYITIFIYIDYHCDSICIFLEQRGYISLYHSQFIKQGIIQTFNQCTLAHQITTAVFLFQ